MHGSGLPFMALSDGHQSFQGQAGVIGRAEAGNGSTVSQGEGGMSAALSKRLQRLEELLAARTTGERSARRVIVADGDDLPEEAPDELLICRVLVTPPERPEEEIVLPATPPITPRTVQAGRKVMADPTRFHRIVQYPRTGQI